MVAVQLTCAACGGRDLREGTFLGEQGMKFKAAGDRWWSMGVPVKARVCMACGALWPYVERGSLEKVMERVRRE